ncbi:unnamed protein product, partial [Lepidochelys kempii]
RLSTANDEIVEVLLSKHQVLAALRFITGVGRHDSVSARKFLNAAKKADDMLFIPYSGSLNKEIRGYERTLISPQGEHCEEQVTFFKQIFGEHALMKPTTF